MEVSLDIETLGTHADCVVLSIGVCPFDLEARTVCWTAGRVWHLRLKEQVDLGRIIDPDTIEWWSKQDAVAIASTFRRDDRMPVERVLMELTEYLGRYEGGVWAKGPGFEQPILESLCADFKMMPIASYGAWRCVRTALDFPVVPFLRDCDDRAPPCFAHTALGDAVSQAYDVVKHYPVR